MPEWAKTICAMVSKVSNIAKALMYLSTLQGAVASVALAAGVSLVSNLLAGDLPRVFFSS